jgi:hypothetical protein
MATHKSSTDDHIKAIRENRKQSGTSPTHDPRNAHKEDQVTNAEEQKEIINEPNYKTDREEEISQPTPELTNSSENPEAEKKEQPHAEA